MPVMSNRPNEPSDTHDQVARSAVDDAFRFVLPSIDRAVQRLDAIDGRIQQITTAIASVLFAAPVIGRAIYPEICFNPLDCRLAIVFAIAAFVGAGGAVAGHLIKTGGSTQMLSIKAMHESHIQKSSQAFRSAVVRQAGNAEKRNLDRLDRRAKQARLLSVVFAVEVALFAVWIAFAG